MEREESGAPEGQPDGVIAIPSAASPDVPVIGEAGSQADLVVTLIAAPLGRPDSALDAGRVGTLEVRAASLRGRDHRSPIVAANAKPRQDDYAFTQSSDGRWFVACVADGVSGAPRSHLGSSIAARRACQRVVDELEAMGGPERIRWDDEVVPRVAGFLVAETQRIVAGLPDAGDSVEVDARTGADWLGTTAVVAIVATTPDSDGRTAFTVGALAGDSSAWTLGPSGWSSLTAIKNEDAEIASNAVVPLPIVTPATVIAGHLVVGQALFIVTDGLGDPLGGGGGEVAAFLRDRWHRPPGMYDFARTLDFQRVGCFDDRTAIGIWPSGRTA